MFFFSTGVDCLVPIMWHMDSGAKPVALGWDSSSSMNLPSKQAKPKMCHSPKVEGGVEIQFFTS